MNIEELELSLRTEFEGQIRNVLAGVKQDVSEFQKKFEAELQKHQTAVEDTLNNLITKLPETAAFDAPFTESVNEHLRLARDDGAQVAAMAFGEAEKLKAETESPQSYEMMRDAVADISSRTSQATILQALVDHAAKFTHRGAFFIVKNDHLVGWKVFGQSVFSDDGSVREVLFPATDDTLLSEAVRTMSIAHGSAASNSQNDLFLSPLHFGQPETMVAIPLTARGRGVAVLYADSADGSRPNTEALETLVRIAGITVELLAASHGAPAPAPAAYETPVAAPAVEDHYEEAAAAPVTESFDHAAAEPSYDHVPTVSEPEPQAENIYAEWESGEYTPEAEVSQADEVQAETSEPFEEPAVHDTAADAEEFEYTGEVTYDESPAVEAVTYEAAEVATPEFETFAPQIEETVEAVAAETESVSDVVVETFEPVAEAADEVAEVPAEIEYSYESNDASFEPAVSEPAEVPVIEAPVALNGNGNGNGYETHVAEPAVETVVETVAAPQPVRTRFSERNVDLPIEVAEDERRLHNDARRFARLLVSEIKLYNKERVAEGCESNDLYDRLREAIDRSREMYDKRVQPAVASKFDYFHYELVNSLAEGDDAKLGTNYRGAKV